MGVKGRRQGGLFSGGCKAAAGWGVRPGLCPPLARLLTGVLPWLPLLAPTPSSRRPCCSAAARGRRAHQGAARVQGQPHHAAAGHARGGARPRPAGGQVCGQRRGGCECGGGGGGFEGGSEWRWRSGAAADSCSGGSSSSSSSSNVAVLYCARMLGALAAGASRLPTPGWTAPHTAACSTAAATCTTWGCRPPRLSTCTGRGGPGASGRPCKVGGRAGSLGVNAMQ